MFLLGSLVGLSENLGSPFPIPVREHEYVTQEAYGEIGRGETSGSWPIEGARVPPHHSPHYIE